MTCASIRLLIPDMDPDDPVFSDAQIKQFLTLSGDRPFIAAALALEVIATDEVLTYKIVRTDDLSVNGVTGADILLTRAKALRAQQVDADTAAGEAFFLVFPNQNQTGLVPEASPWHW